MANNPEFFGQIAIRKNFVSLEQLDKCLRLQKRMHPPLRIGEILLEQKCLSQAQLDDVLAAQLRQPGKDELILIDDETLEKTVLVKGIASKKHLKEARRIQTALKQQGQKKNLAEIMLERKFISITQLRRINNAPKKNDEDEEYPKIEGYDIIKKIRKGGMGTVYKARQMSMDRIIALKVLAPELADDKTYVERFFIEAKAVAKLNDENIVKGYDVGQSNGYYFFVMELINGETILEIMKREKILSVPFALQVTYQTTKALAHAAKHKIIHRDIKPGNIMINLNNEIKLCDLGFAKTSNIDLLTKKGTTLGTPYYMSPEQCRGLQDIDTRSDIYSLGATLYHMLVGKVPFTGSTASEILKKHLVQDLVIPQQRRASLGEHICHLIEKMMAKKREDRYATPQDVIDELEPLMARFEAKKMIVLHPSGWPGAHDLALFLAEGAFVEGNKVDLVSADDVTSEQLTTAGAIVIGSIATPNGDLPPEIRGVLDIMKRFPNDMRGKIGSAFISHEGDGDMATRTTQLYKILQALLSMGLIVEGGFDGIFSGESVIDDYDSEGAEKYRGLGRGLAMTLLNITAGKKTMQKSWGTI